MNILIVEDDIVKQKQVTNFLNECDSSAQVQIAETAIDAINALKESKFSLVILDVLIPSFPQSDPSCEGCEYILDSFDNDPLVNTPIYCIGLTQEVKVKEDFSRNFLRLGWTLHLYSNDNFWKLVVKNVFDRATTQAPEESVDYGVICALDNPELEAFKTVSQLDFDYPNAYPSVAKEPISYQIAKFTDDSGEDRTIVCCACPQMGLVSAAATTTKLIDIFDPKLISMCGITGGVKGEVNMGDLIIASPAWDYSSGKVTSHDGEIEFFPDGFDIPLNPQLRNSILNFSKDWNNSGSEVHIGPLASGVHVVADEFTSKNLKKQRRKVLGIEMETYGVYYAARNSSMTKLEERLFFSCKGVSDYANPDKDDSIRMEASLKSAQFLFDFIKSGKAMQF